jgi:hypothetical protein
MALPIGAMPLRAEPADQSAEPADQTPALEQSEAIALVRATFVRLNDANLTNQYVMLRATGAPDFQKRFSEAELAALFAEMRLRHVDFSRIIALDPVIRSARFYTAQGILELMGSVPLGSIEARFGFRYQRLGGVWKLYGLSLDFGRASKPAKVAHMT